MSFPSERQPELNRSSSSTTSKTDWPRLKAMPEQDIRLTDEHPATEVDHIVRGIARQGLRPVPPKALISLRVVAILFGPAGRGRGGLLIMICTIA